MRVSGRFLLTLVYAWVFPDWASPTRKTQTRQLGGYWPVPLEAGRVVTGVGRRYTAAAHRSYELNGAGTAPRSAELRPVGLARRGSRISRVKISNRLASAVIASSHAAAVVRVGASCGQGVGNGFIVVHPLSMACAHGPEGCPQLEGQQLSARFSPFSLFAPRRDCAAWCVVGGVSRKRRKFRRKTSEGRFTVIAAIRHSLPCIFSPSMHSRLASGTVASENICLASPRTSAGFPPMTEIPGVPAYNP